MVAQLGSETLNGSVAILVNLTKEATGMLRLSVGRYGFGRPATASQNMVSRCMGYAGRPAVNTSQLQEGRRSGAEERGGEERSWAGRAFAPLVTLP